ncbi:MAG: hypothetical protein L3K06_00795 [Thermoplasmata archaeon]|nr:hypothetical protein [Thermoplasmata archaeon]
MTAPLANPNLGSTTRRTLLHRPRSGPASTPRRGRSAVPGALLTAALLLVITVNLVALPGTARPAFHPPEARTSSDASALLAQAQASAALGHGPGASSAPGATPHASAGPNVTFGVVMTYDAGDGYVVAVSLNVSTSGYSSTYGPTELTWIFSHGTWSLQNTTGQVPATLSPGLVYDAKDEYVLLYGGRLMGTPAPVAPVTNQTWAYRAGVWSNLSGSSTAAPFAIQFPNLVYDSADQYVLLFDQIGLSSSNPNGTFQTTWTYSGGVWTDLTATAGAPPELLGAMAYDALDGYVLYFGGDTLANQLTDATWTFLAGTWTNVTASVHGAPSGRIQFGIAYDPLVGAVLMYGGVDQLLVFNASAYSTDLWAYAAGNWTLVATNGSSYHTQSMVFDPADNETLMLGSSNFSSMLTNVVTWAFSGGSWTVAAPAFAAGPRTADLGHAFTLRVTATPSPGGLSYQYSGLPSGCPSVDAASVTCVPGTLGTYAIQASLSGAGGFTAEAQTTVQIRPAPSVLDLVTTTSIGEVGVALGLTVFASSGAGVLSYAYAGLPPGCVSANSSTLGCVPAGAGTYDITATVTDDLGIAATGTTHLEVVPALSVASIVTSRTALDVGQPLDVTATLVGGTGPFGYAYSGLPAGCRTVDVGALTCQPTATGTFLIGVGAIDGLGAVAEGSTMLTVNALPSVASFVASNETITTGGSIALATTVAGGTAPYVYQYTGLPLGCIATGTAAVSCAAVPTGNYTVSVAVVDATGAAASGTVAFRALPAPTKVIPSGPPSDQLLSDGFWWGLAIGGGAIAVAALVGVYRLVLARQGEDLVRALREGKGDPPVGPSSGDDAPRK